MTVREMVNGRAGAVIGGAMVLVTLGGVGGAVAGTQITSRDIQDETIQKRDIGSGAVGSDEVRNGTLGLLDLNTFTRDRIDQPGPQGATGPAGPAGPQGEKGDTGPAGATGPAGSMGSAGPAGAAGAAGAKGDKGDPGATGAQGPAGPKGDPGATGPAGPKGDTGATGPAGPAGVANVAVRKTRTSVGWTSDGRQSIRAQCAPGQFALGGGFSSDPTGPGQIDIVTSDPIFVNAAGDELEADGGLANAWEVEGYYTGTGAVMVSAWAICATLAQ